MTTVRHGMMLVGPSGGGKSCVLRALQKAVSEVKDEPGFDKARVYKLNPKSITMNQLYGSFDLQTGEWTDGIGAVLIRHISQPNTEETGVQQDNIKWMVFDGPVDGEDRSMAAPRSAVCRLPVCPSARLPVCPASPTLCFPLSSALSPILCPSTAT